MWAHTGTVGRMRFLEFLRGRIKKCPLGYCLFTRMGFKASVYFHWLISLFSLTAEVYERVRVLVIVISLKTLKYINWKNNKKLKTKQMITQTRGVYSKWFSKSTQWARRQPIRMSIISLFTNKSYFFVPLLLFRFLNSFRGKKIFIEP